jgi:hypothetical protein
MIGVSIDPDDLEGRRRLSLALAMSAADPGARSGVFRTLAQTAHEIWVVVLAPLHGRVVGISLFVLALLLTADIWLSDQANPQTVRMSTDRPALNSSVTGAASPF